MTDSNRRWVLASRPKGAPTRDNFKLEDVPIPEPGDGEVLCRTLYLSLDPYMRGRMDDAASYADPVQLGEVMTGGTVGEVIQSKASGLAKGDRVVGMGGWQSHWIGKPSQMRKLDPDRAPLSANLGVLGMPGMTAYCGLLEIGKPKEGETVVVAAASGAVGSVVGQIAKIKGATAIGIAGGAEKCAFVRDTLGFDACLDRRDPDFPSALKQACPNGIDVYFENVGGPVFDAVAPLLNNFARIPVCGLIARYNDAELPSGPDRTPLLMRRILVKRLTFRGFIVWDFADRHTQAQKELAQWIGAGRLKYKEDIVDGLDNAPEAFMGLLKGENFGKLLVRVDAPS